MQVPQNPEAVGSAVRVPLPGGLSPYHQEEVEEEKGGHQKEAQYACVCDEGEGERTGRDLTCKEEERQQALHHNQWNKSEFQFWSMDD